DGVIGAPTTVLEAFGLTTLTQVGNNYYVSNSAGGSSSLKQSGAVVVVGQSSGWVPIAAEQTASGYDVAWKLPGADQYIVWNADSNGNYLSALTGTGVVSGTSAAMESFETIFHQDLNGDGVVGLPPLVTQVSGNPIMTGGAGAGTYKFSRGDGQDHIVNSVTGNSASGELDFGAGIASNQLWFQKSNNDLLISLLGTQDRITVDNWFSANSAQLAEIKLSDGSMLDNSVAQLVQAMATYSASNSGFDISTASQAPTDASLQGAITAYWHH
ncbi:MAG TPA: calcium-binding protein, partial [Terriglobales bacterium]|nr:calcium-binding protein [Terriglobales bacterium]